MLAVPGPGNPAAVSPDVAAILATRLATLCSVFRHVQPVAADFPLFLASDSTVTLAPESLVLRLAQLAVKPEVLDSSYLARLLDPLRRQALASALATSPARPAAASSVVLPRELLLNMVRDNRLISPWFGRLYARAGDLSPRLLLVLGAAFLIAGMAGARGPRCGRNLAILTSGLAGAAVSSLLLFSYQVRFGSAYSGIALLVTSFMLGTVIGGLLGSHLCRRDGVATSAFVLADLALAGCAAVVVPLLRSGPAAAFLSANLVAGLCLGLQFAIAGSATSPDRHSPIAMHRFAGRRTGTLTALDLAGGCFGGLLTALVLVPVWGIGIAALSAVAVKLTSVLVSLAAPARVRPV
jgi:hypothetical protein